MEKKVVDLNRLERFRVLDWIFVRFAANQSIQEIRKNIVREGKKNCGIGRVVFGILSRVCVCVCVCVVCVRRSFAYANFMQIFRAAFTSVDEDRQLLGANPRPLGIC